MRHAVPWSLIFWLWLPGVGLLAVITYAVVPRLYRVITWEHTTGTVIDVVDDFSGDEWTFYVKAEFIGPAGTKLEATSFSGFGDRDDVPAGEVSILYDPGNPKNATIIMWGDFLIIILIPLAALLIYLGWPFPRGTLNSADDKINIARNS